MKLNEIARDDEVNDNDEEDRYKLRKYFESIEKDKMDKLNDFFLISIFSYSFNLFISFII